MEEEKLRPFLDFEAQWEQELVTLQRKQEATTSEPQTTTTKPDGGDDDDQMMPNNPSALVEMATMGQETTDQDSLKEVVVTFTEEQKEALSTLPRRQCLLYHQNVHKLTS